MDKLRFYRLVNTGLVDSLARQLDLPVDTDVTVEGNASAGIPFVQGSRKSQRVRKALPPSDPRLVEAVVDGLRERGQLLAARPERMSDIWHDQYGGSLIHEDLLMAVPVTVPVSDRLIAMGAPETIRVWVSDPLPERSQPAHEWDFVGSFLFLVEELQERTMARCVISGVSALRAVVDVVAGHDPAYQRGGLLALTGTADDFGEFVADHPLDKLRRVGGVVGHPRMIETAYKISYMTNEQATVINGEAVRVNDILAYPLYVCVY